MRLAAAAALLALSISVPAHATRGLVCRPSAGKEPALGIVIGLGVAGAYLIERGRMRSTFKERDSLRISQSWLDEQRVWIDLTDGKSMRDEAKLRARIQPYVRGSTTKATGTLSRNGRTWQVRCVED